MDYENGSKQAPAGQYSLGQSLHGIAQTQHASDHIRQGHVDVRGKDQIGRQAESYDHFEVAMPDQKLQPLWCPRQDGSPVLLGLRRDPVLVREC